MVAYSSKGGAQGAELAAIMMSHPKPRVGLAASKPESTPGLAATVEGLTG